MTKCNIIAFKKIKNKRQILTVYNYAIQSNTFMAFTKVDCRM